MNSLQRRWVSRAVFALALLVNCFLLGRLHAPWDYIAVEVLLVGMVRAVSRWE